MFDIQRFSKIAPEFSQKLLFHEQLESTNDEAHRIAAEGAGHGTVVLAEHQTQGRGRRGAEWLSAPGDGLLFSIVLRPQFAKEHYGRIALAAGLGIASILRESLGLPAQLKWPNDILIEGKKCCGILVETSDDLVVLGVGVNVLKAPAHDAFVSINDVANEPVAREETLALLLEAMMREVEKCTEDFPAQLYRIETMSWLDGKKITFRAGEMPYEGVVEGIAGDGSLVVRTGECTKRFAQASAIRCVD